MPRLDCHLPDLSQSAPERIHISAASLTELRRTRNPRWFAPLGDLGLAAFRCNCRVSAGAPALVRVPTTPRHRMLSPVSIWIVCSFPRLHSLRRLHSLPRRRYEDGVFVR